MLYSESLLSLEPVLFLLKSCVIRKHNEVIGAHILKPNNFFTSGMIWSSREQYKKSLAYVVKTVCSFPFCRECDCSNLTFQNISIPSYIFPKLWCIAKCLRSILPGGEMSSNLSTLHVMMSRTYLFGLVLKGFREHFWSLGDKYKLVWSQWEPNAKNLFGPFSSLNWQGIFKQISWGAE